MEYLFICLLCLNLWYEADWPASHSLLSTVLVAQKNGGEDQIPECGVRGPRGTLYSTILSVGLIRRCDAMHTYYLYVLRPEASQAVWDLREGGEKFRSRNEKLERLRQRGNKHQYKEMREMMGRRVYAEEMFIDCIARLWNGKWSGQKRKRAFLSFTLRHQGALLFVCAECPVNGSI